MSTRGPCTTKKRTVHGKEGSASEQMMMIQYKVLMENAVINSLTSFFFSCPSSRSIGG